MSSIGKQIKRGNCVLKFEASWCGPCKQISPFVHEKELEFSIPVIIIDADLHPDICQQFNVKKLPTLIFIHTSDNISTVIGVDKDKITKEFARLKEKMNQNVDQYIPQHKEARVK